VVLRNMDTGRAAVAAALTVVLKPEPDILRLYPPLFLISGGPSIYLSGGDNGQLTGELLTRSFPEAENYVPLFAEPLQGGSEVSAIVLCVVPAKAKAGLSFVASIKNPTTGEIRAVPCVKVAEKAYKAGGLLFFLRLDLPKVSPGTYLVELAALSQGAASRVIRRTEII
ncbi:MAG: hypothetical protein HGA24_00405, partial [Candidatus Aminicenantes bacterium]|nr:hypothetical protein [Candidatus Aminicenantes bacterium]